MLELIAGIVVAFVAVGAVLQPMLTGGFAAGEPRGLREDAVEFEDIEESASPKIQALLALKEIEFDRATGKLSDTDYQELKAKYSRVALEAIDREEQEDAAGRQDGRAADDAAEQLVRQVAVGTVAVCPSCGPRPESDAAFCSDCGKPLTKSDDSAAESWALCEGCGAQLSEGAKFCAECGTKVGVQPSGSAS